MSWFLYLLRCVDGTLYTGVAADPTRRESVHNAGKGAKYTRARLPVTMVYAAPCADHADALRRELRMKHRSRIEKLACIRARRKPGITCPTELSMDAFCAMAALETESYDVSHIAPAEEAYAWYRAYPFTTVAGMHCGRLAGFVNLFPVRDDVFRALCTGMFDDRELTVMDIVDPSESDGALHLFLCCIAVAAPWRGTGLAAELLWTALQPFLQYAERIDAIVTDNVTEHGARFSQRLGLANAYPTLHDSTVHCGDFQTFYQRLIAIQPIFHTDDPIGDDE